MNYRSIANLSEDIKRELHRVPKDVTLVVGIPRSGLLAANLMALYLNLPFTDIDSFLAGKLLGTGERGKRTKLAEQAFKGRALIVDDSIYSGHAIELAKDMVKQANVQMPVSYCAIYGLPGTGRMADLVFQYLEAPRVFEWNIFGDNHILQQACVDIDGVLCIDPTEDENDDGEKYIEFMLSAKARLLPKYKLGTLVTSRLEKYRAQTEAWLAEQGVTYNELVMLDLPDKATRIRMGAAATFKAEEYKKRPQSKLFIESAPHQAETIFQLTGKPVYCVDTNEMLSPETSAVSKFKRRASREVSLLRKVVRGGMGRFKLMLAGR
ncbi:MAG TPA: phosphoribosyltransferase family protein [Chitinophagaceae bacterium]|jgi:uncharacterized HAD superfamily protein/adenine/guanine phosphoribosyltransferase-like PRPP-binding protein|nr:phosphoribosyltransferase family protein [Chitinophagaceae bacterium]